MLADIGRNIDEFFGKISNNLINLKPFNWLAEIKNFNKSEKILFALVICNVFFTFIMQLKFNLYNFYSTYGAGEILINYKGGLVRRGLLGEFYSIFAGTWLFEPVLFISIYGIALIVAYYFIRWMIYVFDPTTLILVFGSPALFAGLFYNWDVLRRDFIIMGGVILIHWLIVNSKKFSYSLIKLLLLMLLIYIPCFLIHESMLFFMGGPFLFLLLLYKGIAKKIWIFIFL